MKSADDCRTESTWGSGWDRRTQVRYLGPLVGLIFMTPLIVKVATETDDWLPRALGLVGLIVFAIVWGGLVTRGPGWNRPRLIWGGIALLTGLATFYTLSRGSGMINLFIYPSFLAAFGLPPRQGVVMIAANTALVLLVGWVSGENLATLAQINLVQVSLSFWMLTTGLLVTANRRLEAAREATARLAVSEERLRFARDLHDLLGHSLSAIALKTELARRLATIDPSRAEQELSEVEDMTRDALREVREAVTGYRQPSLTDELSRARAVLAAAGITLRQEGRLDPPPGAAEATLAWCVREGITNVVRHSRARGCTIRLIQEGEMCGVEVLDDGPGALSMDGYTSSAGSGLLGLAERIGQLGCTFTAGPRPTGGFALRAAVPRLGVRPAEPAANEVGVG